MGWEFDSNSLTFYNRFVNVYRNIFGVCLKRVLEYFYINGALENWNYPHSHEFLLADQADLWLFRFNNIFEVARPMMPNQLAVGAFKCKNGR